MNDTSPQAMDFKSVDSSSVGSSPKLDVNILAAGLASLGYAKTDAQERIQVALHPLFAMGNATPCESEVLGVALRATLPELA